MHDNNEPNTAPPGSKTAPLPYGGGILVLGVDHVDVQKNRIEGNNFYGVTVVDYCLAVAGSKFDCSSNPPQVESAPDDNTYVANVFKNNGTAPTPFGGLENFAGDVTYLMLETGHENCFANNKYGTFEAPFLPPVIARSCR